MKIHHKMICCLLPLVFLSGCNKKNDTQETSKPAPNTNVARPRRYTRQRGREFVG
jgi:hypothetical protein